MATDAIDGLNGAAGTSDSLADPQVAKLLSAFMAIKNTGLRQAIVDVALAASASAGGSKDEGSDVGPLKQKQGRSRKVRLSA